MSTSEQNSAVKKNEPVPATQEELKQINLGDVIDNNILNLDRMAAATKEALGKEELVPIFIPLDSNEKRGVLHPVTINCYRCWIKKGQMVSVPASIGAVVENYLSQSAAAEEDNSLNLKNAPPERLKALKM